MVDKQSLFGLTWFQEDTNKWQNTFSVLCCREEKIAHLTLDWEDIGSNPVQSREGQQFRKHLFLRLFVIFEHFNKTLCLSIILTRLHPELAN